MTTFKIVLLTLLTTAFYAYVGHLVPQARTYPPQGVELRPDMTTDQLVVAGKEIVGSKGTCLTCHTIGAAEAGRFPDLGNVGARAGTRKPGMSDVEYLAESLYEPNAFIVPGFNPGMVSATKPPISLTDQEVLAVIAYLQSLGGHPSVTLQTKLKYAGTATQAPPPTPTPTSAAAAPGDVKAGAELVKTYGCVTCHNFDKPEKLLGPSLYDVGKRLTTAQIYEAIMDPDASVVEGFPPGLMKATLSGTQFYEKVTATQVKTIADYLATLKGSK